jgi:hypothetical protein
VDDSTAADARHLVQPGGAAGWYGALGELVVSVGQVTQWYLTEWLATWSAS